MPQYRVGQEVRYKPVGGPASHTSESVGVIREVITEPGNLTNRNVEASRQNPRYEIENMHTHKRSAIKEENIIEPC
ncbi:hypothetical protein DTO166G4_4042 [Paecilomyces variotii]|uniref:Hypervirulence associated protein TUDOR domain-containing protein n=1 Tax=Byssochlamys spectabilis TaxID=264951 RepID=A0A443I5V1_BYSSP|nr:hypothetical protein C8Q69DRAFT_450993 [Paecilomyces variotii]KAJ9197657.1 hypothetical protein DTO032I3_5880 [Paecilomyces variotii]KAJ9205332.1 hypothetical protein DTO164E3_1310 [Paecilomyces variotii]KAJ9214418.1 hypothetical protein DTO166G4_4042 [Paecilomyces variotii]KAJ9224465.1 hypothetical protein DTO169C6_3296 [Paecilomyces variotii]KAJ9234758.1 hypothetical protein DTO169E5_6471 [Paecilomyces variotii]